MVCLPFSAYSETKSATSRNAADNVTVWDMDLVLPPETGLIVNQVRYNYTVNKIREDAFSVTIQNKRVGGGDKNVFESTDDWSGVEGQTIVKNLAVANIPRILWGEGSLNTTGEGEVVDANVRYSYTFDNCVNPLTNPLCPQPVENRELPLIINPFDSEEVQNALAQTVDIEEDDERKADEENSLENKDRRRQLARSNNPLMTNAAQLAALFEQMALVPKFEEYYAVELQGGTYKETVELKDATLPDNRKAMRSLSKDQKFNKIIRSQYEK